MKYVIQWKADGEYLGGTSFDPPGFFGAALWTASVQSAFQCTSFAEAEGLVASLWGTAWTEIIDIVSLDEVQPQHRALSSGALKPQ